MSSKNPLAVFTVAVALVTAGCASTGYQKAETSSASIQDAAQEIDRTTAQIDVVLASLSDLLKTPGTDFRPQFERFESALSDLEGVTKAVTAKAEDMQRTGTAYFDKWDADLAKIQNEEIRARSAERRNEVAQRFQRLRSSYELTRTALVPFMSDLRDIRTALAADLTLGGISAIQPAVGKAKERAQPLREALRQLASDFNALGVALAPKIPKSTL